MNRDEAHEFLLDLLGNCVPKGQVDRVGQFYTQDVVGHFRGEKFFFRDLQERIRLLGENVNESHLDIMDFMQFDEYIFVVSRQNWRQKGTQQLLEVIMSVVYRMRDDRIAELWVVWDTKTDHFSATNKVFPEAIQHLAIEEKNKTEFIRYILIPVRISVLLPRQRMRFKRWRLKKLKEYHLYFEVFVRSDRLKIACGLSKKTENLTGMSIYPKSRTFLV